MNDAQLIWLGILALAAYLVPAFVAFSRKHRDRVPILALNVLLGWTLLFWVAALVWALCRGEDIQKNAIDGQSYTAHPTV